MKKIIASGQKESESGRSNIDVEKPAGSGSKQQDQKEKHRDNPGKSSGGSQGKQSEKS